MTQDTQPTPIHQPGLEPAPRWWLFRHNLGGDQIAVHAVDAEAAAVAVAAHLGLSGRDAFAVSCCCGPSWDLYEGGPSDDGSFPDRPAPLGDRWDGSPRDTYLHADDVARLLATSPPVSPDDGPNDGPDDGGGFVCC